MKTKTFLFIVISFLTVTLTKAQCYSSLTQTQNNLLDKYNIDYTGLHTRYMVSTNGVNTIEALEIKQNMVKSYSDFMNWKSDDFKILPDTVCVITGFDYTLDKIFTPESELVKTYFNFSYKIVQKLHIDINRDGIKSIEILEYYISVNKSCVFIQHCIFIEDYFGVWGLYTNENDPYLDCPLCSVF